LPLFAAFLVAPGVGPVAQAQEGADDEVIEEIVTTGTRRAQRSAADSAVPIDVVSGQELENMGTTDLNDMLRNTVPSYNIDRQPISDAATLVRPATMRGLPPDNVLILVNGKRRHRSGVIAELGGSLAAGSQGADLSSIPALAIRQTEILRDGAAAQYGSDAIAGVLNFVLKEDPQGFTAEGRFGEYLEGDGTLAQFAANAGLPLGDDGFANITFQWREQDPTSRSTQRTDAQVLIDAGNADVRQPYAQIWGAPEYRDDFNVFINAGIQLSPNQEVYAFGNVGGRETEGGFFYRNPNSNQGTFTHAVDGVTYRAIADMNISPDDVGLTSNCPALASPGGGFDGLPLDPAAVDADNAAVASLPDNCWLVNSIYPGGYTPQFGGTLEDTSMVIGLRGELDNGLSYDFSGSYGRNDASFFLANTWNPSLGPDGIVGDVLQSSFDLGSYIQSETNFNADFVYPIEVGAFASPLNIAFGAEWRDEVFSVILGEENAWQSGRFAFQSDNFYSDGVTPLGDLSIGAHGFAGFSPTQAGKFGRSNIAAYTELEADLVENFTLAAALRFEDFEDFGSTVNGKLAARLAFTDGFALRGSASTGFRAPTPGQSNVTKVSTRTVDGVLRQSGQIPPTNPIAQFLGGAPLEPEEAVNFSAGVVWDVTDTFNLTLDFFLIDLEDRIAQTGQIDIAGRPVPDDPSIDCPNARASPTGNLATCLQELGIPGAADLTSVAFFTNDFQTTTTGVDLVATWNTDFGAAGNGLLVAAWNWTDTEVDDAGQEIVRNRVVELENLNPEHRGIFTYNHFLNDWRFLARASYYDEWIVGSFSTDPTDRGPDGTGYTLNCDPALFRDKCYDAEWLFDFEVAYQFTDNWTGIIGAQNVFDEFGPIDQNNLDGTVGSGNTYDTESPFGFDGGFWYVRVQANFE
jgi:iron complex outermembrane receptor protein